MEPRDLVSTTWYLNERMRIWYHFPVVVKIEVREMRVKRGKKRGERVGPQSQKMRSRNSEISDLCLDASRSWFDDDAVSG